MASGMNAELSSPLLRAGGGTPSIASMGSLPSMHGSSEALPSPHTPPFVTNDPLWALRPSASQRSLLAADRASLEAIRERYMHHLSQYRLVAGGFVPNLAPILRWDRPSRTPSAFPSPSPDRGSGMGGRFPSPGSAGSGGKRQSSASAAAAAAAAAASSASAAAGRRSLPTHKEQEVATSRGFFRPGSVRSSIVNVSAAALGAGALALPRAIYYSGIVLGPMFMLLLAVLSIISIKVIVQLVEVSGKDSYEEIAKVAFGPWFALLVEVNIILFCFGTAVAYMITVGQISHQVVQSVAMTQGGEAWWADMLQPNAVLSVVTVVILLPLSLLDSINDLRFASLLGVSCILYLIMVVVYVFCFSHISDSLNIKEGFDGWQPKGGMTGCFKMLSLAIFAFCCQPNVPSIYVELERRSFRRMELVSIGAMLLCLVVYLLMGVTGFLAFGETTAGNVLQNLQPFLCERDLMVTSGFGCMAFAVTMAFPLNIFPIRFAVETALFYKWPHLNNRAARLALGTAAVAACYLVAIALPEVNIIFELIGATTGSFVCFIGPGLLLIRLLPGSYFSPTKRNGVMLVAIGVTFLVLGTYSSVLDVMAQFAPQDGSAPPPVSAVCPQL